MQARVPYVHGDSGISDSVEQLLYISGTDGIVHTAISTILESSGTVHAYYRTRLC